MAFGSILNRKLKHQKNRLQLIFIMQSQETQERISQLLAKIAKKLNHNLLSLSFEAICKIYKEISIQLSYFLQYLKFGLSGHDQLRMHIVTCMNTLKILLESTEYHKYSHRFPIFHKLLRNYQLVACEQLQPVQKLKVIQVTQKNQKSHFCRMFGYDAIQSSEIKFLKSERAASFFSDLRNQEIILQNPQCVCCSQVFIKNFKIFNKNPLVSVVAELSQKKGFDQMVFQSYVNAVCNKRGGTILIGMERKDQNLIASGIKFNTFDEIHKRQTEIQMAIIRIKPICHYLIERVLVHTNYTNPTKISQENMRICFRISIFPYEPSKINYSQISNKGYHRIYQVFKFDLQKKPYKVISTPQTQFSQFESLYTMMHEKYRQTKETINSHQNIYCFRPFNFYSKLFNTYASEGFPPENEEVEQVQKGQQNNEDDPKFKYQNTSLLIVGSKKGERFIDDFQKALIKKKEIFQISKPFESSFRDGVRSIWMITHPINFIELKNYHKGLEVKNVLKQNSLIMMPVYKTLEIQRSKFYQNKQFIEKKFSTRYGQLFQTQLGQTLDSNKKKKSIVYLHFNSLSEAIYTYLIFEELQLKPYFTKDGNIKDCQY